MSVVVKKPLPTPPARERLGSIVALVLLFVAICTAAFAYSFPALTGRVVDAAHILSPATVEGLEQSLTAYEQQSTNQVVVTTVPSLQGGTIEDYGYQLGRAWGIGQKGKDNGVLLIVAPHERKVRIEVGYGLEGTLTDALSNAIIQSVILPDFRSGEMEKGVVDGTRAIISVLGGSMDFNAPSIASTNLSADNQPVNWVLIIFIIVFFLLRLFILPWWFPMFLGGGRSGSGSGFSGGFSGGGGSFGGGGASGGW